MKTLYLHVGMHKAGSTSIQRALNKDRKSLIQQGLYFPLTATDHNTRAHQNIAWELNRHNRFVPENGSLDDLHKELQRKQPQNVIISSEGFTSLDNKPGASKFNPQAEPEPVDPSRPSRYQRLREFADSLGYSIVTVGFVREYVACLNSAYTQQVKNFNHARPFADHVAEQRGNDRWCYEVVFAGWESISDKLICLPNGEDNVKTLYQLMGVKPSEDQEIERHNTGVGPRTIECSRLVFKALEPVQRRDSWLRNRKNKDKNREQAIPSKLVKRMARQQGWNDELFWGFDLQLARDVHASFVERDHKFLRKHQIHFADTFDRKRHNDFMIEQAEAGERATFLASVNPILAELGLAELS
ncbi:hypothetical protein [Hydrocarboniphaga sp.]|uniref:hypothetical protein n=1 Tax=Hydrocarboniphaga sp. TaxID=2033016 RepID=UPI003D0BC64F